MNFVASNYLSLKYQKSTTLGSIDIGIRIFEFVAKTQFLLSRKWIKGWVDVMLSPKPILVLIEKFKLI